MDDTSSGTGAPSGRFLLRIDPSLHSRLRETARKSGLSLNDLCALRLAAPLTDGNGPGAAVVARAADQFGEALCAVIAYGSWARDEPDVLVAVDDTAEITRDLYRAWDQRPLSWRSHDADVHFARPPSSAAKAGGMWLDIAIDGVVLFDRDLRLSRTLAEIRSLVATGRIVRHRSHGQSYWVEAADHAKS